MTELNILFMKCLEAEAVMSEIPENLDIQHKHTHAHTHQHGIIYNENDGICVKGVAIEKWMGETNKS